MNEDMREAYACGWSAREAGMPAVLALDREFMSIMFGCSSEGLMGAWLRGWHEAKHYTAEYGQ